MAEFEPNDVFLRPGELLSTGTFRVDKPMTAGGFAIIYEGTRLADGAPVAIKTLRSNARMFDPVAYQRFEREAAVIEHLDHPNIVRTLGFGKTAAGALYMVLERLDGYTLLDIMFKEPLDEEFVREILGQTLNALVYAHDQHIIHRDIKPANLIICRANEYPPYEEGTLKLLDFGFAKVLREIEGDSNAPLTLVGQAVGTPGYMAPETLKMGEVTPAADLYSLGTIAYELLTAQRAFEGEGIKRAINQAEGRRTPVPERLSESKLMPIVDRMMERKVKNRFANAREVLAALEGSTPKIKRKWYRFGF
ncbi:MAG: hypothetical protein AUK47_02925 [Deltaproteobacteria bacterium CG2_30_63_29]|nr:MAG: hypothetical protein AUK47_02925 [Deltaproteobacteria bacterium CG2_30_63_29]